MSEPAKDNPKTSKRSKRKAAMEPLGWDEIVSQPGMGGYLSFLNGPVPLPHLQSPATESVTIPEIASIPDPAMTPVVVSDPGIGSGSAVVPDQTPGPSLAPGVVSSPEIIPNPEDIQQRAPEVVSIPAVLSDHRLRIRKCASAHDGHSLGEEVLYQALWKAAAPESGDARTIVIGWRGMSQLCRMTPKNCKINTQRLIRKLALEVLSPYNTPESIGTTYRVFADDAILRRRRAAGLEWVVRSRGVEFVDPSTGNTRSAHLCGYASEQPALHTS